MPNASYLLDIIGSDELLVASRNLVFLTNLTLFILVQLFLWSSSLIIAGTDISSMKGTSILMNLWSLGFSSTSVLGRKRIDLFKNVYKIP